MNVERLEQRRDLLAGCILAGFIARGEGSEDPFGKIIEGADWDQEKIGVSDAARKRMLVLAATAFGFANDLARMVAPPPWLTRGQVPVLKQRGVQKIVYRQESGLLIIEIWISPDFYDPALGAAPGREAVEQWIEGTVEQYRLEWWRTDTGEGPFPEP